MGAVPHGGFLTHILRLFWKRSRQCGVSRTEPVVLRASQRWRRAGPREDADQSCQTECILKVDLTFKTHDLCACVHASAQEHVCGGMCGGQRSTRAVILPDLSTLCAYLPFTFDKSVTGTYGSPIRLREPRTCVSVSPHRCWDYNCTTPQSALSVGTGDQTQVLTVVT